MTGDVADVYRLLAGSLCEPDRETLRAERVAEHLARLLDRVCPAAAPAAQAMGAAIEKESDLELRVEYARLFVGPHELPAPPYGSVYLEPGRMVMGETTAAAAAAYEAEGLAVGDAVHDLPDHMAVELEFLSHLAARESAGEADLAEKRRRFLREHPAAWVTPFCAKVRESTTSDYYRALAECLETFLLREAA